MSQILTLELPDRLFDRIRQEAENIGIPMERLTITLLEQKSLAFRLLMTEEEKAAARKNFESHFRAIAGNQSVDNESIDADLSLNFSESDRRILSAKAKT